MYNAGDKDPDAEESDNIQHVFVPVVKPPPRRRSHAAASLAAAAPPAAAAAPLAAAAAPLAAAQEAATPAMPRFQPKDLFTDINTVPNAAEQPPLRLWVNMPALSAAVSSCASVHPRNPHTFFGGQQLAGKQTTRALPANKFDAFGGSRVHHSASTRRRK
jgi:hypothetical protein